MKRVQSNPKSIKIPHDKGVIIVGFVIKFPAWLKQPMCSLCLVFPKGEELGFREWFALPGGHRPDQTTTAITWCLQRRIAWVGRQTRAGRTNCLLPKWTAPLILVKPQTISIIIGSGWGAGLVKNVWNRHKVYTRCGGSWFWIEVNSKWLTTQGIFMVHFYQFFISSTRWHHGYYEYGFGVIYGYGCCFALLSFYHLVIYDKKENKAFYFSFYQTSPYRHAEVQTHLLMDECGMQTWWHPSSPEYMHVFFRTMMWKKIVPT